jgi:hypothetical protein
VVPGCMPPGGLALRSAYVEAVRLRVDEFQESAGGRFIKAASQCLRIAASRATTFPRKRLGRDLTSASAEALSLCRPDSASGHGAPLPRHTLPLRGSQFTP